MCLHKPPDELVLIDIFKIIGGGYPRPTVSGQIHDQGLERAQSPSTRLTRRLLLKVRFGLQNLQT